MSDDNTRTGFGFGLSADKTRTITSRKIQIRMMSGKIYGPYTRVEVLSFIKAKRLTGEESMLVEGESQWRLVTTDTEFFDAFQAALFGVKPSETPPDISKKESAKHAPQKTPVKKPTSASAPKAADSSQKKNLSISSASGPSGNPAGDAPDRGRASDVKVPQDALVPARLQRPRPNTQTQQADTPPEKMDTVPVRTPDFAPPPQSSSHSMQQAARSPQAQSLVPPQQPPQKPARAPRKANPLLWVAGAAIAGGVVLTQLKPHASVELNKPRNFGVFNSTLWYAKPLSIALKGLNLQSPPFPVQISASAQIALPEAFGARAWIDDIKRLVDERDPRARVTADYWARWAWDSMWLGATIDVIDSAVGGSMYRDGLAIADELEHRKLIGPEHIALFKAVPFVVTGKWTEALAVLQPLKELEIANWLSEECLWQKFWADGGKGVSYRSYREEYSSNALDLSSKLRQAFIAKDNKKFSEDVTQIASEDPASNVLWLATAEVNWRFNKDGVQSANRLFQTGLATLSLVPGSLQQVYWQQYAEFLGTFGRQSTAAKALSNYEALKGANLEPRAKAAKNLWWDLNATELDINVVAKEVMDRSGSGMINARDLATLYVLGFAMPNGGKYLSAAAYHWAFEKQWTRAVELFSMVVQIDPQDPLGLGGLVWSYASLYQFDLAFKAHDKFGAITTPTPEAAKFMAVIQLLGREYDQAVDGLVVATKAAPNDAWAHYFLALSFLAQEKNVDCARSSNLASVHATGELQFRSRLLNLKCRVLARIGTTDAIGELKKIIARDSENIPAILTLIDAQAVVDEGEAEAIQMGREALERFPRSFDLRMKLGDLYQKRRDYDRAVAFYKRAKRDRPDSAEPSVRIGQVFDSQKKYIDAAQNYEIASRIEPSFPEVWLYAARSYAQVPGHDKEASQMYAREIEERPAVIGTFLEAAEFLLKINAPQEVPPLFRKFKDDFQDDPRVLTRLAQAYLAMQDYENAQNTAATALAKGPNFPEPNRVLGYVYEQQGQYEMASNYFEKYLQLLPQAADADQIRNKLRSPPYK